MNALGVLVQGVSTSFRRWIGARSWRGKFFLKTLYGKCCYKIMVGVVLLI